MRSAIAELIALRSVEGLDEDDIRERMGYSLEDFEKLKNAMYSAESQKVRTRTTEQTYIDYCHNQLACVHDLEAILEKFKETRQHSAMVGAVRARSDIYDKIIAKGQEFGLIEKKPEEKRITAGLIVAKLSDGELRKMIAGELASLDKMMRTFGDKSLFEIDEGDIHYELPGTRALLEPSGATKHVRSRTSRVSKGRSVVKESPM